MKEEKYEVELEPMTVDNVGPQDMDQNPLYPETIGDGRIKDIVDPDSDFENDTLEEGLREDFSKAFQCYLINNRSLSFEQVFAFGLKGGLFDNEPRSVEECAKLLDWTEEAVTDRVDEVMAQIMADLRIDPSEDSVQEKFMEKMCASQKDKYAYCHFDSYSEYLREKGAEQASSLRRLSMELAQNPFASRNMARDQK